MHHSPLFPLSAISFFAPLNPQRGISSREKKDAAAIGAIFETVVFLLKGSAIQCSKFKVQEFKVRNSKNQKFKIHKLYKKNDFALSGLNQCFKNSLFIGLHPMLLISLLRSFPIFWKISNNQQLTSKKPALY